MDTLKYLGFVVILWTIHASDPRDGPVVSINWPAPPCTPKNESFPSTPIPFTRGLIMGYVDLPSKHTKVEHQEVNLMDIELFLASARLHCPDADIIFWTQQRPLLQELASKYGVMLRRSNPNKWVLGAHRYLLYKQFLDSRHPYSHILLTDVRDVIFQGDPFAHVRNWSPGVYVVLEDPSVDIQTEFWNRRWLVLMTGQTAGRVEALGYRTSSCSGTVLGTSLELSYYVSGVVRLLKKAQSNTDVTGIDQGAHNLLIRGGAKYGGNIVPFCLVPNGDLVLSLARIPAGLNKTDTKIQLNGFTSPVVHQYDRAKLSEFVRTVYVPYLRTKPMSSTRRTHTLEPQNVDEIRRTNININT